MKVAIIGGGFFGFHIAREIVRKDRHATVHIYERNNEVLCEAAYKNQCRLHLGFHYPRSGYTIYQSVLGYDRYVHEYGECIEDIPNNLYAVHKDGFVTAEQYLAVMDSFSLDYEVVKDYAHYFRDPQDITVTVRVKEKCINPRKIVAKLKAENRAKVLYQTSVDRIDSTEGKLYRGTELLGQYDAIVNATYTNPNLGLSREKRFNVKWELCMLVVCQANLPKGTAITIMDGGFGSLYPAYEGLYTASSVQYTPFLSFHSVEQALEAYCGREELAKSLNPAAKVVEHVQSMMNVELTPVEPWVVFKAKLADGKGDTRITEVRSEGCLYSVFCGKLDAAFSASDRIVAEII